MNKETIKKLKKHDFTILYDLLLERIALIGDDDSAEIAKTFDEKLYNNLLTVWQNNFTCISSIDSNQIEFTFDCGFPVKQNPKLGRNINLESIEGETEQTIDDTTKEALIRLNVNYKLINFNEKDSQIIIKFKFKRSSMFDY